MALVRIDLIEGRTEEQIAQIQDTVAEAMRAGFGETGFDRFHIVYEHKPSRLRIEHGSGKHPSTKDVVLCTVTGRPRPEADKLRFNSALVQKLKAQCGIGPDDVILKYVENTFWDHASF